MKTRQRILVHTTPSSSSGALLRRAGEIAASRQAELLVVSVLDTRSGFEPDGPAGNLPGERAARRAPAERQRLERQLKQNGLGQAQSTVIWGEPRAALSALIHSWRPDLVMCEGRASSMLPAQTDRPGPEMMTIGRGGPFSRLAELFLPHAQGHA
jgi:nucleotide-binding universal stress UspA family protein